MNRLEVNPAICSGKPVVRGTRIMVRNILGMVAGVSTVDRVLEAYPDLARDDVISALSSLITFGPLRSSNLAHLDNAGWQDAGMDRRRKMELFEEIRHGGADTRRERRLTGLAENHTRLTRCAGGNGPYTPAHAAGHSDFATKRYVHPREETIREAMRKAEEVPGRHKSGHSARIGSRAVRSRVIN